MCKERLKHYDDIGALEHLSEKPALLQPLHVVVRENKKDRLVIDLSRNLNDELSTPQFNLPHFREAVALSSPCCWYGKMDLSDCFLSFDIHPDSRRYLAFELDGKFYRWKRLPFGLSSSPYWCEEFLGVIDFALRAQLPKHVRHLRYVDDYLFISDSRAGITEAFAIARRVLAAHGLRVNEAKTEGPLQRIIFLGLGLDSTLQESWVPEDKLGECRNLLKKSLKQIQVDGRLLVRKDVQSLVGKLSFISAVLPGARPFFRALITHSSRLPSRFSPLVRSADLVPDLDMWLHILRHWTTGSCKWPSDEPEVEFVHDACRASDVGGFGFYIKDLPPGMVLHLPHELTPGHGFAGDFDVTGELLANSIQWAELFAIAYCLTLYGPYLRGRAVLLWSDNMADVYIINRQGTRCPTLLALLRAIYSTAAHYHIRIRALHIRVSRTH